LEQRVGERTRELEALYRVTAVTVEHLDLRSILRSALGRALSALDGSAGAIHLKSDTGWRLQAQHGLSPSLQRTLEQLPASHSLFSHVAAGDEPYLFTPASEPPLPANAGWQDFQTHMGAPMHAGGEVVGIFSVFGREPLPYTVEEIALIASIADQVGIAVGNAALHREAEEAAALRERQQLSRDLHDSVTQTLYSIKLYAEATQANTGAGEWEKAAANGEEVTRLARQAMREMRLLLYQLQKGETLRRGLYAALRERLQMVEERGAIKVDLSREDTGKLPVEVEQALFGAAQEALNNIVKHSEATAVSVRLLARPHNHVSLIIEDNGKGFLPTRHSPGMGLDNMRHRLLEVGGAVALSAQPEMGAQVHFQVKLE
jgi:signal transduction histidine kinase